MTFITTHISRYPRQHDSLKDCLRHNNYFAKFHRRTVSPYWWTFGYSDDFRNYGSWKMRRATPVDRRRVFVKYKNKPKKIK